jgi:hypothetical protein
MNRKRLVLAVLGGMLILSLGYAFWATPRQEKAPPRVEGTKPAIKKSADRKPAAGKIAPPQGDRLHLGLLSQEPQPFPGTTRDIFRLQGGGAAPAPEVTEATAPPPVVEVAPPPPPPPPPTPEEILREKTTDIKILGSLDKGGVKTVFLSFEGTVSVVKAGERFGKNRDLVAKEITASELVVGAVDGPETIRVRLVEKEAPSLSTMSSAAGSPSAGNGAVRSGGMVIPPRRGILSAPGGASPQAAPEEEAVEQEAVEQEEPPPIEDVIQEEPVNEEPPSGEGNGNN